MLGNGKVEKKDSELNAVWIRNVGDNEKDKKKLKSIVFNST